MLRDFLKNLNLRQIDYVLIANEDIFSQFLATLFLILVACSVHA